MHICAIPYLILDMTNKTFTSVKQKKRPWRKHNYIRIEIPGLPLVYTNNQWRARTFDPHSKYEYKNSNTYICHGMLTVFTDIPERRNIETTEEIR